MYVSYRLKQDCRSSGCNMIDLCACYVSGVGDSLRRAPDGFDMEKLERSDEAVV